MKILYPGFRKKCVTFSFDDGEVQDRQLAEMFREYNLKGTFNIITNGFGKSGPLIRDGKNAIYRRIDAEDIPEIYRGMEVAAHGATHADFTKLNLEALRAEVYDCIEILEKYADNKVKGLAYPGGQYDKNAMLNLDKLNISYARTIQSTYSFDLPDSFLEWHPTCHYSFDGIFELIEKFKREEPTELRLFYIYGHSFEMDKTNHFSWEKMEDVCDALSGQSDIWYATNSEICTYMSEAARLECSKESVFNPTDTDFYIEYAGKQLIAEAEKFVNIFEAHK